MTYTQNLNIPNLDTEMNETKGTAKDSKWKEFELKQ